MERERFLRLRICLLRGMLIMTLLLVACSKLDKEESRPFTPVAMKRMDVYDGKGISAKDNYLLRLDVESGGDFCLSDEAIIRSVLSIASKKSSGSNDVEISTMNYSEIDIKAIRPLHETVISRSVVDSRAPIPPMVVEFNGPDGDGYAVCSGDRRYEQVFAYVPYGNLSDTVYNTVLRDFYRSVEYCINDSIVKFNAIVDSLTSLGYKYEYPSSVTRHSANNNKSNSSLPPGMVSLGTYFDVEKEGNSQLNMKMQWGQAYPYNDSMAEKSGFYLRDPKNLKALAGCTTIALGQAMVYKKSPYYPFITSKLSAIRELKTIEGTEYAGDVARFIAALANDTYVKYGIDGTTTNWMNISDFFDVRGIKYEDVYGVKYNTPVEKENVTNFIFNSCSNKEPVIVHAKDTRQGIEHAFIVHGVDFKQGQYYEIIGTETPDGGGMNKMYRLLEYKHDLYVQINWGYNGRGDGRFYWNQFKVLNDNYDYITMMYTFK